MIMRSRGNSNLVMIESMQKSGATEMVNQLEKFSATYRDFRPGDIRHSLADISKAKKLLHYKPTESFEQGLKLALEWYIQDLSPNSKESTAGRPR